MQATADDKSRVEYNTATNEGGGVYVIKPYDEAAERWVELGCNTQMGEFTAENTSISFNAAASGSGGGLYGRRYSGSFGSQFKIALNGCSVKANSAGAGINGTTADGLYYRHDTSLTAFIYIDSTIIQDHNSAGVTFNGNVPPGLFASEAYLADCALTGNDVGITTYNADAQILRSNFDANNRGGHKTHALLKKVDNWIKFDHCNFLANGTQVALNVEDSDDYVLVSRSNIEGFTAPNIGVRVLNYKTTIVGCAIEFSAAGCYWGHASGPHDSLDDRIGIFGSGNLNVNPPGSTVFDGVGYYPYSTTRLTW